jgi:hypothetical protein
MRFQLDPLGADARPVFCPVHDVSLTASQRGTALPMTIRVTDATAEAAFALAGIELGWQPSLDKVARVLDQ